MTCNRCCGHGTYGYEKNGRPAVCRKCNGTGGIGPIGPKLETPSTAQHPLLEKPNADAA